MLAFGLGLTFVPLTLTAVAGVDEDSVRPPRSTRAQQIGGAIGLAALTTVFTSGFNVRDSEGNQVGLVEQRTSVR